jgi:hypothetical protein
MAVIPKGSVFLLTQGTFELVFAVCRARIDLDVDASKVEFAAADAEVDWGNDMAFFQWLLGKTDQVEILERYELWVGEATPTQLELTHLPPVSPDESPLE